MVRGAYNVRPWALLSNTLLSNSDRGGPTDDGPGKVVDLFSKGAIPTVEEQSGAPTSVTARTSPQGEAVPAKAIKAAIDRMGWNGNEEAEKELIGYGAQAVPHLIPVLRYKNTREWAGNVLVAIGEPSIDSLKPFLQEQQGAWRALATNLICRIGGKAAVEPLTSVVNDKDKRVFGLAIEKLGNIGEAAAIHPLLSVFRQSRRYGLQSNSHHLAREALIKIGGMRVVDAIIKELQTTSLLSYDTRGLIFMLGEIGDERPVDYLAEILRTGRVNRSPLSDKHNRAAFRNAAADALAEIGGPRVKELLIGMLDSEGSEVKGLASHALCKCGDQSDVDRLVGFINDGRGLLGDVAVKALMRIDPSRAADEAFARLGHEDGSARKRAINALVELKGEEVVGRLISALHNEDVATRRCAAHTLGRIGDERAVQHLIDLLTDPDEGVRTAAYQALMKMENDDAVPALAAHQPIEEVYSIIGYRWRNILYNLDYDLRVITEFVQHDPDSIYERSLRMGQILQEKRPFGKTEEMPQVVHDVMVEHARKEELLEQAKETVQGIGENLRTALGLHYFFLGDINDELDILIMEASSTDEARGWVYSLNYFVHRMAAEKLQNERKIKEAGIKVHRYPHLDPDEAARNANGIMLDRWALEMARKIYVHSDGHALFDEEMRQAIATFAYYNLATNMHRFHVQGILTTADENIVRRILVCRKLMRSNTTPPRMKGKLRSLIVSLEELLSRRDDDDYRADIDRLTGAYNRIFRATKLPV